VTEVLQRVSKYLVPTTWIVMMWLSSFGNKKAKPKSALLDSEFLSNKLLQALML